MVYIDGISSLEQAQSSGFRITYLNSSAELGTIHVELAIACWLYTR